MIEINNQKYLELVEVAEKLNLGYLTVWKYARDGVFPVLRTNGGGRKRVLVREEDLKSYVGNQAINY